MSFKNYDDVVYFPLAPLPPVIGPSKSCTSTLPEVLATQIDVRDRECVLGRTRKTGRKRTISEPVSEVSGEDKDSDAENDSDFECVDSDYEVSKGDDDLYADNVDEESDDDQVQSSTSKGEFASAKGKVESSAVKVQSCASKDKEQAKTEIKDDEPDEEDLWAPKSDNETVHLRFKFFREADLTNPKFYVGQVFSSVELLRKAVRTYSCIHRKDIKFPVNDKKRVNAKCGKQCSWYLWASYDNRTKGYMIKRYEPKHSCSGKWKVYSFTANFIAEKYLESFRADQDMNLKNFSRVVQKGWNMTPGRSKLQRARRVAMKVIYGDEEQQYKILWDYANEIRRSNPGSSFYLSLDENARFKQCYMCLEASKRGLINAVKDVFPDSEHRHMEEMRLLNADAHAWLDNLDPKTWVKAFQSDMPKCDILLNNNCEVFNKYILEARELPLLSMFERVKSQIMTRNYTKLKDAETWTGPMCPKIRKKVDKNIELSNNVYADPAGDGLFAMGELVSSQPVDYVVDLEQKTCSCMRWQKTGIPCAHITTELVANGLKRVFYHLMHLRRMSMMEKMLRKNMSYHRQGELAQRLLQMQQEKTKANEERKIAILEAKYAAEVKKAEGAAKKKLEQEKRKAEQAQAKAREAAEKREKRRQDAELTKKAREETRKFIAEVRKELAEKKRKEAAEKKMEAKKLAAQQKEVQRQAHRAAQIDAHRAQRATHLPDDQVAFLPQQAKKVNMFDEFRAPRNNV
ncbi:hypothetical protein ACQ4PT_064865 [Festuca glaucescens]